MKIEATLLGGDISQSGPEAERLEAAGVDAIYSFEGAHDPFFPLLLAAGSTRKVELGTAIAIAFARNPMICANIANDLQQLSKGRFILGLGSQIKPHIEKRFSQTWSRPAARMREFVMAIRAIFRTWNEDEPLAFRGEFYTHTIMTPFFNPGPNPFGPPRIFLAAVGPRMLEMTGEVGDGVFLHPLNTVDFVRDIALPSIEKGLQTSGRSSDEFEISCQTICMMGSNDEEIAQARSKARGQISFYGSTPAYKVVLDHAGWGDLQPRLNRMSKEGKWAEMMELINDDMLDAIGVSGTPDQIGASLRERNTFADRTSVILYDETGSPDALSDLVRAAHG
uniref:Coenzyme F420-dependent N5,N10-methylene tetrahydromethanopterin reductase and related flavin-dependent oxidoreductases n=1 Tax=uncultured myxobacterium HF0200_01L06 TaxID=723556 RepID=E7C3I5_9BACT|nr:coenzyme F420-dependent N5,N10-methylene tetrahydromethanopterin reductase and related flavin-dependent oxidoreductases [uncultured myxobacterium HF0200_01L06]